MISSFRILYSNVCVVEIEKGNLKNTNVISLDGDSCSNCKNTNLKNTNTNGNVKNGNVKNSIQCNISNNDSIKIYFKQDLCRLLPIHIERKFIVNEVFRMIDNGVYGKLSLSKFIFTQKQAIYIDYSTLSLDSKYIKSMYKFIISLFKKPNAKTKACGTYCMIYTNLANAHRVCKEMKTIRRSVKLARQLELKNVKPPTDSPIS